MGFSLGLAASAYQGAKAEQRRMRDDDFVKAQHDYAMAQMDEQQGRRGYRDNAAALADAEVQSKQALMPQEAQLRRAQLESAGRDQAHSESTRADREATGLLDAKNKRTTAENIHAWDEQSHIDNAAKIDEAIAGNDIRRHEMRTKVFASLYQFGREGKGTERDIVARFNSLTRSQLIPELHGKTIASAKKEKGGVVLRDSGGNVIHTIADGQMEAAYAKQRLEEANKNKVIKLSDGQQAYRTDSSGNLVPVAENVKTFNPNTGRGGGGKAAGGGKGGGGNVIDRMAAALKAEAKANGKEMNDAEAYRTASASLKANPGQWAMRDLQNNYSYQGADPAEKKRMEAASLESARGLAGHPAAKGAPSPELGAASAQSQGKVRSLLGL